jgi:hypothetical protein
MLAGFSHPDISLKSINGRHTVRSREEANTEKTEQKLKPLYQGRPAERVLGPEVPPHHRGLGGRLFHPARRLRPHLDVLRDGGRPPIHPHPAGPYNRLCPQLGRGLAVRAEVLRGKSSTVSRIFFFFFCLVVSDDTREMENIDK